MAEVSPETQARLDRAALEVERIMARYFPRLRDPHYRYFSYRGWRYCWTTERLSDGYHAFIYRPVGKGSRSGTATHWRLTKDITFTKRATAKRRALRWWETARAKGS